MPLSIDKAVDPHPEVTEFARQVVATGSEFQDMGKWCDTWRRAVRDMGLDPGGVFGNVVPVEVDVLIPVRLTAKVSDLDFAGLSPQEQMDKFVEMLKMSLSINGNNIIGTFDTSSGKPNMGRYSEVFHMKTLGEPVVIDAYQAGHPLPPGAMNDSDASDPGWVDGLWYANVGQANEFPVAMHPTDGLAHIIPNVRRGRVDSGDWVSCCYDRNGDRYRTREWKNPTETPTEFCEPCINRARNYHGIHVEVRSEVPADAPALPPVPAWDKKHKEITTKVRKVLKV